MADKKISELPSASALTGTEIVPLVQGGTTDKTTTQDIANLATPDISGLVPYTGATSDVDLDTHILNAQSVNVKGTGGNGHLGLKHQSADATASASETVIFAGSDGEPRYKNDGGAVAQFASRAWVAAQGYITSSALSPYLTSDTAASTYQTILPAASALTNGYLTSIDWSTFNGKLSATITSVLGGDILEYNSTTSTWVNSHPYWTVELIQLSTIDFYTTRNVIIDSITNIVGSPTITILDDGVTYTLGNTIAANSKITVSTNIQSVVKLNIRY